MESWWETLYAKSTDIRDYLFAQVQDDTCGWGQALERIWSLEKARWPEGLLLTGPAGCGRHNTAVHTARFLMENRKFDTVFATGRDFWDGAADWNQVCARVDAMLTHYDEVGENGMHSLCLVLEQVGSSQEELAFLDYLARTLYVYRLNREAWDQKEAFPDFFLILIEEQGKTLPPLLRQCLRQCRMAPPSLSQRKEYLEHHGADVTGAEYIPLEKFAQLTDGFSYAQLRDTVENVCLLIMRLEDTDADLPEEIASLIQAQNPCPEFVTRRRELMRRAEEFLEKLPEALAKIPVSTVGQGNPQPAPAESNAPNENTDLGKERERFETEPVKELFYDCFYFKDIIEEPDAAEEQLSAPA